MGQPLELWGRIPAANMTAGRSLLLWQGTTGGCVEIVSLELMDESVTTNSQLTVSLREISSYGSPVGTTAGIKYLGPQTGTYPFTEYLCNVTTEPTTKGSEWLPLSGPSLGGLRRNFGRDDRPILMPGADYAWVLEVAPGTIYNAIARIQFNVLAT
jgi:hypothetical protein